MATVFEALENDWARLARSRQAARQLPEVCRIAGGAGCLGDVEVYVRAAEPAAADAVLLALARRAVNADVLAARVLLQLLLPGTRSLARRWWALGDDDERAAAAVTAVYDRIRSYPLARRPGRVAANILLDAAHELRRSLPKAVTTPCADPSVHATRVGGSVVCRGAEPAHPAEELSEVLADAVGDGVISAADAELIARSRIAGHRVADIAQHRGLRPRTLWDRRQRAERTLVAGGVRHRGAVVCDPGSMAVA